MQQGPRAPGSWGRRRLPAVSQSPQAPAPSAAQLEAEIAEARSNLASTIEQLKAETTPQALVHRGVAKVKGVFTDEYGGIRPERVAIAAGVVVTLVVFRRWRRSRRCHCH
ncbi:MAG: DUF3618 domain-containing protein [Actinobacteria bacterium]|nr:DUF3618 domain-containing protein [Actinomycetota bacterium]